MSIRDGFINLKSDLGARGDGLVDDAAQLQDFFSAVPELGAVGHLPTGRYRSSKQLVLDLGRRQYEGVKVEGVTPGASIIIFDPNVPSPNFILKSSRGDGFHASLRDFGFYGNTVGPVVQIGSSNYSDPLNELELRLQSGNTNQTSGAIGMLLNYVLNSEMFLVANAGGASYGGTGMKCRQVQMSHIKGSFGAAGKCLHLTEGYNLGNHFTALDVESGMASPNGDGVVIDNMQSQKNAFMSGEYNALANGFNATSGLGNVAWNPIASGTTNLIKPGASVGLTHVSY